MSLTKTQLEKLAKIFTNEDEGTTGLSIATWRKVLAVMVRADKKWQEENGTDHYHYYGTKTLFEIMIEASAKPLTRKELAKSKAKKKAGKK